MGVASSVQRAVARKVKVAELAQTGQLTRSCHGLKASHVRMLYDMFNRADADKSRSVTVFEFLMFFNLERSVFAVKAFTAMDANKDCSIDFAEFVRATWNYASLNKEGLRHFSFALYDLDGSGRLERRELEKMVRELYGADWNENHLAKTCLNRLCSLARFSRAEFLDFARTHPALLFPAFQLQQALQNKLGGAHAWSAVARERGQRASTYGWDFERRCVSALPLRASFRRRPSAASSRTYEAFGCEVSLLREPLATATGAAVVMTTPPRKKADSQQKEDGSRAPTKSPAKSPAPRRATYRAALRARGPPQHAARGVADDARPTTGDAPSSALKAISEGSGRSKRPQSAARKASSSRVLALEASSSSSSPRDLAQQNKSGTTADVSQAPHKRTLRAARASRAGCDALAPSSSSSSSSSLTRALILDEQRLASALALSRRRPLQKPDHKNACPASARPPPLSRRRPLQKLDHNNACPALEPHVCKNKKISERF